MNRKLIFLLSLFGLFMAVGTVFLIPPGMEPGLWLFIFLISAYFIAKNCHNRYFLHGFFVNLLNSVWITAAQIIFYGTYIKNHPQIFDLFSRLPTPYSPRISMLMIGPAFGAAFGIVLGIFAFVASRIVKK